MFDTDKSGLYLRGAVNYSLVIDGNSRGSKGNSENVTVLFAYPMVGAKLSFYYWKIGITPLLRNIIQKNEYILCG